MRTISVPYHLRCRLKLRSIFVCMDYQGDYQSLRHHSMENGDNNTFDNIITSSSIPTSNQLLSLPHDILQKIMALTMGMSSFPIDEETEKEFLDVSHSAHLQNGIALASTCRKMYHIFRETFTSLRLVSSWDTEQKTLFAACNIADTRLRYLHIECSAPVSTGLRQVVYIRPPLRHLALIGVNIAKVLITDMIHYAGQDLKRLTISAAPSLDQKIVELIASHCRSLEYIELGCSRSVTKTSLCTLFEAIGSNLRAIDLNALQHETLDDDVLLCIASYCTNLTKWNLLKLRWVTDSGLFHVLKFRGHQLTQFRLHACRRTSLHVCCMLTSYGSALKRLSLTFEKGNLSSISDVFHYCELQTTAEANSLISKYTVDSDTPEKALLLMSMKCQNLIHLSVSQQQSIQNNPIHQSPELFQSTVRLSHIKLRTPVRERSRSILGSNSATLVYLDVSCLSFLTDATLQHILESQENSLQELRIMGCFRLTDHVLRSIIPQFASSLRVLQLSYCNFSLFAISELRRRLPDVTIRGNSNYN